MNKIRKHYILYGSVQGVGLRYRAYYAAQQLGVTGYIRNLDDGSVEMEAEGNREALAKMMEIISSGHFVDIERIEEMMVSLQNDGSFDRE